MSANDSKRPIRLVVRSSHSNHLAFSFIQVSSKHSIQDDFERPGSAGTFGNHQDCASRLYVDKKFAEVDEKLMKMQGAISRLQEDVSTLKEDVSGLKQDVSGLKSGLQALETSMTQQMAEMEARLTEKIQGRRTLSPLTFAVPSSSSSSQPAVPSSQPAAPSFQPAAPSSQPAAPLPAVHVAGDASSQPAAPIPAVHVPGDGSGMLQPSLDVPTRNDALASSHSVSLRSLVGVFKSAGSRVRRMSSKLALHKAERSGSAPAQA